MMKPRAAASAAAGGLTGRGLGDGTTAASGAAESAGAAGSAGAAAVAAEPGSGCTGTPAGGSRVEFMGVGAEAACVA